MEQQKNGMDDELYALLDTALQDERLTVSEELIGKVLRRVGEETAEPVVMTRKKKLAYRRYLPYAGVAAAAALVLVLGRSGSFTKKESMDFAEAPGANYFVGNGMSGGSYEGLDLAPSNEVSWNEVPNVSKDKNDRDKAPGEPGGSPAADGVNNGGGMVVAAPSDGMETENSKGTWDEGMLAPSAAEGAGKTEVADMAGIGFSRAFVVSEELWQELAAAGYPLLDTTTVVWEKKGVSVDWEEELAAFAREDEFDLVLLSADFAMSESVTTMFFCEGERLHCFGREAEAVLAAKTKQGTLFVVKDADTGQRRYYLLQAF